MKPTVQRGVVKAALEHCKKSGKSYKKLTRELMEATGCTRFDAAFALGAMTVSDATQHCAQTAKTGRLLEMLQRERSIAEVVETLYVDVNTSDHKAVLARQRRDGT